MLYNVFNKENLMSWNFRVVKHSYKDDDVFQIHEVYYKNGQPDMISENGIVPFGEDLTDLSDTMIYMMQALTKPVLDAKIFEKDPDPKKTIDQTLGMLKNNTIK